MNTQTQEALKMAIEALEMWDKKHIIEMKVGERWIDLSYAINACKEALEQPAQEPVAWYWDDKNREGMPYAGVLRGNPKLDKVFGTPIPLYTHPHQWQGLTAKEIASIPLDEHTLQTVEKILKEKNT